MSRVEPTEYIIQMLLHPTNNIHPILLKDLVYARKLYRKINISIYSLKTNLLLNKLPPPQAVPIYKELFTYLSVVISNFLNNKYIITRSTYLSDLHSTVINTIMKYDYIFSGHVQQSIELPWYTNYETFTILDDSTLITARTISPFTIMLFDKHLHLQEFDVHNPITCIARLSASTVVIGFDNGDLLIWNYITKTVKMKLDSHKLFINHITVLSNGTFLSVSHLDVRLWTDYDYIQINIPHVVNNICVISDQYIILNRYYDWSVYNVNNNSIQTFSLEDMMGIYKMSNSQYIVTTDNYTYIYIYSVYTNDILSIECPNDIGAFEILNVLPNNKLLIVSGNYHSGCIYQVWDLNTQILRSIHMNYHYNASIVLPNAKFLYRVPVLRD